MNRESRQAFLLALLPALIAGAAYVYLHARPARSRVKVLQAEVDQATAARPGPGEEQTMRMLQASLGIEIERAKTRSGNDRAGGPRIGEPAPTADVGSRLAALLKAHGLTLLEDHPGAAGIDAKLPKALEDAGKNAKDRLRTLRFRGRYADVAAAMGGLKDAVDSGIPLRLEMKPAAERTAAPPEWTLVLWI
ncbi:MAG: hypothetical protein IT452_02205 [Planctomycetia bacterium]|nr:hypothetical protein [Planctomycetia bacterium]